MMSTRASHRTVYAALAAAAFAAGCSTTPLPIPRGQEGPAIVFLRDSGFGGGGCSFYAIVDGQVKGDLYAGDSLVVRVEPGRHRVGIENSAALCTNVRMAKVIDVGDAPVVLRIGLTFDGQRIFDQVE